MLTYADAADVEAFTGEPAPDGVDGMIRSASVLVQAACRCDVYDTDPAGLPADDDVAEAMQDAVCAQVGVWQAAGIDPVAGAAGIDAEVTSSKILDGQVQYDGATVGAVKRLAAQSLTSSAYWILRNAGLASSAVASV